MLQIILDTRYNDVEKIAATGFNIQTNYFSKDEIEDDSSICVLDNGKYYSCDVDDMNYSDTPFGFITSLNPRTITGSQAFMIHRTASDYIKWFNAN